MLRFEIGGKVREVLSVFRNKFGEFTRDFEVLKQSSLFYFFNYYLVLR